jgi:two-component system sensor histidine kinase/response regulator
MHEAAAGDKGLQLDCVIDPALPRALRGDAMRLRQVLLNFLGNAIKFSAQRPHRGARQRGRPGCGNDGAAALEVSDQGIGISVESRRSCSGLQPG